MHTERKGHLKGRPRRHSRDSTDLSQAKTLYITREDSGGHLRGKENVEVFPGQKTNNMGYR